ncbi:MAG: response regulator [Deltaproteobacteria bacterium]|nr:response regulator [Deltaproteobacteria bacterium]
MPKENKKRLTQVFLVVLSGVSMVSIVLIASLWVYNEKRQSQDEFKRISTEFYDMWRNSIRTDVNRIALHIDEFSSENQVEFFSDLKKEAIEFKAALERTVESLGGTPGEDSKDTLALFLQNLVLKGGREELVLIDLSTERLLSKSSYPDGGTSELQEVIKSVTKLGEAFYHFNFLGDPQGDKTYTYLMVFSPLNWALGVSWSLDAFEREDEEEILEWLESLSFPQSMNMVLMGMDGEVLVSSVAELEGNLFYNKGRMDFREAAARVVLGARDISSDYIDFTYRDREEGADIQCLGYFRAVADRNWVILGFVDLKSLQAEVAEREDELRRGVNLNIFKVLIISLSVSVLIFILYRLLTRSAERSFKSFFDFFDNAESQSTLLNPDEQPFQEFSRLAEAANRMTIKRQEAEELLRENEAKFRSIFEVSPQVVTVLDENLRLIEANSNFTDVFGLDIRDSLGKPLDEILGIEREAFGSMDAGNGGGPTQHSKELEYSHPAGRVVYLLFLGTTLKLAQRNFILGIFIDISQRKRVEQEKESLKEKLSRSQTMETMGLMASEVAHELNNILSGIVGYPELLLKDGNLNGTQTQIVSEILDAGKRAAAVVADLLTLAQGAAIQKQRLDLSALVKARLEEELSQDAKGPKVKVNLDLDKAIYVDASVTHLKKSVDNLLANAFFVSKLKEGEPQVTVKVSEGTLEADIKGFEKLKQGRYAILEVTDNGGGIPEEIQPKIFEPFYTGKGWSGRGLGLTVVANTVKALNGAIDFDSSSKGTTFRVYLPEAKPPAKVPQKAAQNLQIYQGKGERILVVDDVDIQRKLSAKMLSTLNYSPSTVSSGEEAVEFLKTNDCELLILDMIMRPGMNGRETYEAILKFKPQMKAIIASGMAEGEEVEKAKALGATSFILKPYTVMDLAKAIYRALYGQLPLGQMGGTQSESSPDNQALPSGEGRA